MNLAQKDRTKKRCGHVATGKRKEPGDGAGQAGVRRVRSQRRHILLSVIEVRNKVIEAAQQAKIDGKHEGGIGFVRRRFGDA
ncbi:MAG: hypothetical protein KDE02_03510 [Rhodobacteraceae bacterium]|nr:hypothetical protein [Paracoccaceae bacterium]